MPVFSLSWERLRRPRRLLLPPSCLGLRNQEFRGLHSRLRELGRFFLKPEMRRRRSAKPKALSNNCETSATDPLHSCSAWNRVELYNEVWDQPLVKLSRKYGISDVRWSRCVGNCKYPTPDEVTGRRGRWVKLSSQSHCRSSRMRLS